MPAAINTHQTAPVTEPIRWTPDDLLGEVQLTLQAVADVELRYELARERVEVSSSSTSDKHRCLAELEALRQMELEPFARRLDELERQIRSFMT
jgi:hypothetical protein